MLQYICIDADPHMSENTLFSTFACFPTLGFNSYNVLLVCTFAFLFWVLLAFPGASPTYHSIVFPQALAGEVGMSSELDEVARALFNGQIPNIWRKLAPATLKSLGNWMEHFLKRLNQYNNWVSASFLCRWRIVVLFESQNQSWLDEI